MDSAPASPGVPGRLSPEAKAAQVQRVRDSLLMTKDLPGKGLDDKKTRRVLPPMSPGTGGGLDENSIMGITGKAENAVAIASDQFDAMAEDQNTVSDIGFEDVREAIGEINRSLADGTEPDWYDAHDAIKAVYVNAEDEGWINGHVQKQGLLDNIGRAENALMMAEDSYDQMIEDTSPQSPGTSEQGDAFAPLAGDGGLAPGSTLGANQGSISMTGAKIDRWARWGGGLSDEPLDPMVSAELDAIPPGESARVGDVMVERIPYRTMDGGPGDGETAWIVPRSEEGNKANPLSKGLLFSPNYPLRDHENAASAIARIRVEAGQRAQDKNIGYREAMTEIQTPSIPLPQFPRTTPMSPGTAKDTVPNDEDGFPVNVVVPPADRMRARGIPEERIKEYLGDNFTPPNMTPRPMSPGTAPQPLASGDRVEDPDSGRTGTYQRGRMTGEPSVVWDDTPDSAEFYYEGELVPLPKAPKAPQSPGTLGTVVQRQTKLAELIGQLSSDKYGTVDGRLPAGSETAANLLGEIEVQAGSLANQPGGGFASLSPMQRGVLGDIAVDNNFHTLAGRADINQLFRVRPTTPVEVLSNVPTGAELNVSGARYKKVGDGEPGDFGAYVPVDENGIPKTFGPNTAWSKTGNQLKDDVVKVARVESGEADVTSLYFDETASLTEAAVAQELARTQRKLARQKPGARDKDLVETAELLETLLEDVSEADPQD
jgi:hypothetical protein